LALAFADSRTPPLRGREKKTRKSFSLSLATGLSPFKDSEEKESGRWVKGFQAAQALAKAVPQTEIICVADSEADLFEVFSETQPGCGQAQLIVRACQDRVERFVAMSLIVAWRISYLCHLGRECPELSCEAVFAP
jgi:hypothetical protein